MSEINAENNPPSAVSPGEAKQRSRRNIAIALSLGAFILIVFAVTILRLGGAGAG